VLIGLDHTRSDKPMHSCVTEAREAGLKATSLWLSDNPSAEDSALGDAVDGVFMRATWVPVDPNPLSQTFARAFHSAYGVEPEYHAAGGYACCQVLEQAVETTGNFDNDALRKTLLRQTYSTVMGKLQFQENGLSSGAMQLCQWQNGKLEIVYPESQRTAAPIF
jgi:branched-chain amino acid transport system substrate-binding protein